MKFQKLSAPSLKELFVTELENKILSGELNVGEKLPSERELAASMQVSRAVVNAGIAEMEQKGFLIVKPRVGTFVEDYRKNGTLDTLVSIMKYNGGSLAKNEIKSILELRIVLVTLAAELTIEHTTDDEINQLYSLVESITENDSTEDLVEKTFQLHHELAFISGNTLLPLLFVSFKDLVCKLWTRFVLNYGKEPLIESDKELVKHLVKRDIEGARKVIAANTLEAISSSKGVYS